MKVTDAMQRCGVRISPAASIVDAAKLMEQRRVGTLVVVEDETPVGVVTVRDIRRRGASQGLDPEAPVTAVMSRPVVSVEAETDVGDALRVLAGFPIRHLVVVRDSAFAGVVTVDDLERCGHPSQPRTSAERLPLAKAG